MEEAIKKIISLLEEGKISVEEAERLIKAVKEAGKKESEFFGFRWIPEMIEKKIKDSIRSAFIFSKKGEISTEILPKDIIQLKSYTGDVEIKSEKRENIKIEAEDALLEETEHKVFINSHSGDLELFVPEYKEIYATLYSGDIELSGNFKKIKIQTYSGDIYADVEFDEINIATYTGNFKLKTKRKPILIKVDTYSGEIKLPEGFKKEGDIYIYGEKEYRRVNIESHEGDFELKFKEE
ncbi:MAG: DUF4097 family beta strand repeat-containing protein [Candidatus Hydrothermales bacterium]